MTNTSTSSTTDLSKKTPEQLRELKASYDQAAAFCTQQQNVFWGKGVHDGADMFAKNAESFDEQSQAIQEELDSRVQEQDENLTKEQKKSLEEQPKYPPANLAPADQPKPATQPVELSTEAQKQKQDNKSSSTTSTSSSSSTHKY